MAEWETELPGPAEAGNPGHPEDHNLIVAAIAEARSALDAVEQALADHRHAAGDVTSGTFAVARIPDLAITKVTGLQAALDGKQASGSYATVAQVNAKADASDVTALEGRVSALEAAAEG